MQAGQMKIDIAVSEVEDVARTIEEASDKFLVVSLAVLWSSQQALWFMRLTFRLRA